MKRTEAELAAVVVEHLKSAGHDVYEEVEYRGAIIDIVSLAGPEVWIIETKLSWSLELLEQCVERKRYAHRVWAAVPASKSNHSHLYAQLGIGSMVVSFGGRYGYGEGSDIAYARWPDRTGRAVEAWPRELRKRLGPGYQTHAKAGSPNGAGRWTPFRETCERLLYEVRKMPGIALKDAIGQITTHYSSARAAKASLAKWIEGGKVPGVRMERDGKLLRLYPASPSLANSASSAPSSE